MFSTAGTEQMTRHLSLGQRCGANRELTQGELARRRRNRVRGKSGPEFRNIPAGQRSPVFQKIFTTHAVEYVVVTQTKRLVDVAMFYNPRLVYADEDVKRLCASVTDSQDARRMNDLITSRMTEEDLRIASCVALQARLECVRLGPESDSESSESSDTETEEEYDEGEAGARAFYGYDECFSEEDFAWTAPAFPFGDAPSVPLLRPSPVYCAAQEPPVLAL